MNNLTDFPLFAQGENPITTPPVYRICTSPCPRCKHTHGIVKPLSKGPHAAVETCAACTRHRRWVSKKRLALLELTAQKTTQGAAQ